MPTPKLISAAIGATGLNVYAIIRRDSDGYLLDDASGAFGAAPTDPYLSLPEHATIKGLYEASEARAVWADGVYTVVVYERAGATPAPASDKVIGVGQLTITGDVEVSLSTLQAAADAVPADIADRLRSGVVTGYTVTSSSVVRTIVRGDAARLVLDLGADWDLTGRKAYLCLKSSPTADNDDAIVNREVTVTDALSGVCEITLTSEETATVGRYYGEVEVREADESSPMTALQFTALVVQDVRQ